MDKEQIGEFAGIIWRTLNEKGKLSFEALLHETMLDSESVSTAIGWLAREDKIRFDEQNGITAFYSITNAIINIKSVGIILGLFPMNRLGQSVTTIYMTRDLLQADANYVSLMLNRRRMTLEQLSRITELSDRNLLYALGWLLCEDELFVYTEDGQQYFELRNEYEIPEQQGIFCFT